MFSPEDKIIGMLSLSAIMLIILAIMVVVEMIG